MFDLSGRVALVTGAGRGAGAGIAAALAAQGAAVAVNDLRPDRAQLVAAHLGESGARAIAIPFDVTNSDAVDAAVSVVAGRLGPVDILVNNAGVPDGMAVTPFREMSHEDWERFVDLNLYGSLNCIRAVMDPMVDVG